MYSIHQPQRFRIQPWGFKLTLDQIRCQSDLQSALICSVTKYFRFPESSDRQDLPYTEAALLEVVRLSNVTPRGLLPHANMAGPVKIGDYTVPEAHTIQASFGLIFTGDGWNDPEKFDPDRFIDEESGKVVTSRNPLLMNSSKPTYSRSIDPSA